MKKHLIALMSLMAGFNLATARAQPVPAPRPNFDGAIAKLFGANSNFSANMEFHYTQPPGGEIIMPGTFAILEGKSRFDMDLSSMLSHLPAQVAVQMKQMGMEKMTTITRRDKKLSYILYPELKAYVENATQNTGPAPSEYKAEVTRLGEETMDGHHCIKNKVVVTGPDGYSHESTVWNASDLKQFPLKIETKSERGTDMVMLFRDVKLDKPNAAQFEPPADFKKYDSAMSLMTSRTKSAPPQ